ncbi:MAG: pantoate--beta-alanine ligase [Bacteroidales bacterium]|jgi:pantoate--beta-alanine ligase
MITFHTIDETRRWINGHRTAGMRLGFVPTMGALHDGHLELVRRSVTENDFTAASIFVNPIQFNNPDDLKKYPRTLEADQQLLQQTGCDLVFAPSAKEMYPSPATVKYDFGGLEKVMEGASRPGHFNGVAIVVKKLFDIITPDRAYFGEKDFQQLRIIQALVEMENIPVEIITVPTMREADGLAMSSRNRRLTKAERAIAPEIYQVLLEIRRNAGKMSIPEIREHAVSRLEKNGFVCDYVEIAAAFSLRPLESWDEKIPARAFVACYLGNVRLIDNLEIIY